MKTKILIVTTLFFIMGGLFSSAATLIVSSYFPKPEGVYTTIQAAYNAASPGDTIIITPAEGEYAGITIAKEIHIIGNGWSRLSESVPNTKTSGFTFNAGAEGSSITGLEVNGMFDINTDNITVKRNKLYYIYVQANCTNVVIIQNFISSDRFCCSWWETSIISIWENTEVYISNNIIINTRTGSYGQYGIYTSYPTNVIVCNNVFNTEDGAIIISMSGGNYCPHRVFNNIIKWGGGTSGVAASYDENNHNMGNSTQFGTINNNQQNVDMNTVFVDATNHDYHLKEGSPAIGAGLDGTDCGIYGGAYPFVDNGRTWLPTITEVSVPAIVNINDGIDVSVKAKSGK
ncbi:MAG TPA: hypothetical protein PLK12_16660 [Prolixibacteraceae bacterium]|nr:hypothetical protein [Prolixibacteraceae bacterium]